MSDNQEVICADETRFPPKEYFLVGSVKTVRGRSINKPARVGEFPVLVDKYTTKIFTYSRKIKEITDA
ncbi:hypothetical protein [Acetobacter aceti]|uniref:Uncharacterized protein n=1 Tax=Acetobacter aceti TaxID=435 RepID=A0A6S6PM54_ACEAC|nr:hypothetical protein [Acetobacter aceti]BCI68130.1 hypothetical protein AAJCM20276_27540 [Acetobacter aceti]